MLEPNDLGCATSNIRYGQYSNSFEDKQNHLQVEVGQDVELQYGNCYELNDVVPIEDVIHNHSSFKYRNYMKSRQIIYTAKAGKLEQVNTNFVVRFKNFRLQLINSNRQNLGVSGPYVNALLLGDNQIDNYYKSIYGQVGIAAIFAISGMHIALIYGVIIYYLSKFRVVDTTANKIALIVLVVYSLLAGNSVAVNRAVLMSGLKLVFNYKSVNCLYISGLLSLLYNPFNILNQGYVLSYMVTLIILKIPKELYQNKSFEVIRFSYLLYFCALPFSYSFNYTLNLFAPIAMLLITPIVTFGLMPLSLILTIVPNKFCLVLMEMMIGLINKLALFFNLFTITSGHIKSVMWIALGYIGYLFVIKHKFKIGSSLLTLWLLVITLDINIYPKVTFIDVGQGDGALIEYQGYKLMIDVGQKPKEVWRELRYLGVHKLDAVFISHAHADHYGALETIERYIPTSVVYELADNQIIQGSIGLKNIYQNPVITIVPYFGSDDNNRELIIKLNLAGSSFLFPGDIETEAEAYLVSNYCQQLDSDIIKVPHHGSKSSSTQEFIDCVSPEYAIISSGHNNQYDHPSDEVVVRYMQNSTVYDTQFDGEITITVKPHQLKIKKKIR